MDIKTLVRKLGGCSEVAHILGVSRGAVSQWRVIPRRHLMPLWDLAQRAGLELSLSDLVAAQGLEEVPGHN